MTTPTPPPEGAEAEKKIRRKGKGAGFDAYYYSFIPTGCEPVDKILMAVAGAGASYHNTSEWGEETETEASPKTSIQTVADEVAKEYAAGLKAAEGRWISVKERLPEDDDEVLALSPILGPGIWSYFAYPSDNGKRTWTIDYFDGSDGLETCTFDENDKILPTHWISLPPAPSEGE